MKKLSLIAVFFLFLTAFAKETATSSVFNIIFTYGPYKPFKPEKVQASRKDRIAFYYSSLLNVGEDITIDYDNAARVDWWLNISSPKITVSEATGTPSNRFVTGTSFVSYYEVMDGKLRGSCVLYLKDKSMMNVYSKVNVEINQRPQCR